MLLFATALLAASAQAPATAQPEKACRYEREMAALRERAPNRARKLGELPPADHYYAVLREEDGCLTPVKVRERR